MKILILTSVPPYPLDSGGAQAIYNMIDELRKSNEIHIVYPIENSSMKDDVEQLSKIWPNVHIYAYPLFLQYINPIFLAKKVLRLLNLKFRPNSRGFQISRILDRYGMPNDLLFVHFLRKIVNQFKIECFQVEFYPYLPIIEKIHCKNNVFIQHEIRYIKNKRMLSPFEPLSEKDRLKYEFYRKEEISLMNRYDAVVTLTDIDKEILKNDGVITNIFVSPAAIVETETIFKKYQGRLVFIGGYSHKPNVEGLEWFISDVYPLIDKLQCEIDIIGKGWPDEVRSRISKQYPKITFCGFVQDLSEYLCGAITIVPIQSGSGMRMKILESAHAYSPIVSTNVGAEGLAFENEIDSFRTDNPATFAERILDLANDTTLYENIAYKAKETYNANYSKEALAKKRSVIYENFTI